MKTVNLPQLMTRANFKPDTLNKEKRTIDVVWSTGARVRRSSFWDGPFYEELGMNEGEVRMERLNSGASVLDTHNRYELKSVLGVIENARLENGEGVATIRFSKRDDVEPIFQDVVDGVIRNLSAGYKIHKLEKVGEQDDIPIYRAIDWEPAEISFVPVPAEIGTGIRSESKDTFPCQIITRESGDMSKPTTKKKTEGQEPGDVTRTEPTPQPVTADPVDTDAIARQAVELERKRCADIRQACTKSKMPDEFSQRMIDEGKDVAHVRELIIEEFAKEDDKNDTRSANISVGEDNARVHVRKGVEAAIMNRFDHTTELDDNARQYQHSSVFEMARACVEGAGISTRGMNRNKIVGIALRAAGHHSSSDFPIILENIISKTMQMGYVEAPRTWEPMARQVTVPDFKQVSRTHLGEFSQMEEVLEGGEYKHGKLGERGEKYAISKFGKLIAVTREMIINDDMDAFTRIPAKIGKKARDLESDKVWELITANAQVMAETGLNLFDAGHNNINEGGAGAVSETTLSAVREAMRLHEDLDGSSPLNLFPTNIWVPAAREVETMKILRTITPNQSSQVNLFGQDAGFSLTPHVEPRLDAVANSPWLVGSDTRQTEMLEVARLAGEEQPSVESREGFEVDGVEFKIRHHFVAHAIDYRGFSYNEGA